ncbi:MAG TPA: 2-oxo-4-hydroxy-4-carboxy-5-ureidoimidazoline decarboxylase [Pyrinomonadaceae bacterium]|jgi:OHCU decarboxylase|nr:2-oxo-4-hydroxy-4-carboxy-5-ureidoimidazoline decarboxylase [Pyrinomonadaceae bacterium]
METAHDLDWLNALPAEAARAELLKCCGSTSWAKTLAERRPFPTLDQLLAQADEVWWALDQSDWLEAFRSHPKIGEKKAAATPTTAAVAGDLVAAQSQQWSAEEQRGVARAGPETVEKLARLNRLYEEKFGFIFIVCATSKSTDEILALLEERIGNEPAAELSIAASEQAKITGLRLRKLLEAA